MAKPERNDNPSGEGDRPASEKAPRRLTRAGVIIFLLVASNLATYGVLRNRIGQLESWRRYDGVSMAPDSADRPVYKVVNAHDHLYKLKHLPKYLQAAEETGIDRTIFVASSAFTFLGKSGKKDEMNEWSTQEILQAAEKHPGKVIPFCTLYPGDADNLEKLRGYVAQGVRGLKLYSGHSSFYELPLDHPSMMDVYAYCEEIGLPICWHVRLQFYKGEFRRVMAAFPNLRVIIPHFGVAFYQPNATGFRELRSLLDTYPNLYVDTSFGTRAILVHGLEIVSENREFFREFFETYSDRIVFGTDMVVTGNKEKTEPWVEAVIRACRDVLEKDTYHYYLAAKGSPYALRGANNLYGELRGLALPEEILRKIYETNIEKVLADPSEEPERTE